MSLLLLSFLLLACTLVSLITERGDFLSPQVMSFASFFASALIAFMHEGFSGSEISFATIIITITSLLVFSLGYQIGKPLGSSGKEPCFTQIHLGGLSEVLVLCSVVFEAVVLYFNYNATLAIARLVYADSTVFDMLLYARNAYLFTDASIGTGLSVLVLVCNGLGYFFTYDVMAQIVARAPRATRTRWGECLGIGLFLANALLGSGRTFLIKLIVFVLIVSFYLYYSQHGVKSLSVSQTMKLGGMLVLAIALFFAIFQVIGLLTRKTDKLSVGDMLYSYSGAAIVALDSAIPKYAPDGRFFGEECFFGLYGFLNKFGFNIPNSILHLPFTAVGGGLTTNIYTSLRSYLYDFGFFGLFFVQLIIGLVSGVMYGLLRSRYMDSPTYLFLYSLLMYGIAMQGIEEILLRNFMSVTNVISFLTFSVLCMVANSASGRLHGRRRRT